MNYEILEDCSPYFIRYKHTGSDKIIAWCKEYKTRYIDNKNKIKFMHIKFPTELGSMFLDNIYGSKELELIKQRVSMFVTQSNFYYRPHRDGLAVKVGINYNVDIRDDLCVTSWYDNNVFAGRPIDTLGGVSREIGDYNRALEKDTIKPIKSMVAKQGEVILFNTDYYHDVDNLSSPNERTVLTLRSALFDKLDFFEARKRLFNF
jgi:hypothetical protein